MIENHISSYLKWKGIFAWKVKTVGTYDTRLGRFRKPGLWYRRGVSDILGVYRGRFMALEVKSEKGKLTTEQMLFFQDVQANGGYPALVRCTEDVEAVIKRIDQDCLEGKKCSWTNIK